MNARAQYTERRARHLQVAAECAARADRLAAMRLAAFVLLLIVAWLAVVRTSVTPAWVLVPLGAFFVMVVLSGRASRARRLAERAAAFHARGLARLDGSWPGQGVTSERWRIEQHPYAADLDLFGAGSLFELLCEARTAAGERTLAAWLQQPAAPGAVLERQAAVRELRDRLDFREALSLTGEEVRDRFDERALMRWAREQQPPFPAWTVPLARTAVAALVSAVAGAALGWWAGWVVVIPLAAVAAVGARLRATVQATITDVGAAARELAGLADLLAHLEAEPVTGPGLTALRHRLTAGNRPASVQIWRLRRLIGLLDSRGNQLVMFVLPLMLWTTQVAAAIARWRVECGPSIADWIAAAGEYEALASLAGYAFEHPEDAWPEITAGAGFQAEGLGHPLLAGGGVRNEVRLAGECRLLVVSGSNMSGKSTLLRSVGTAVVMAHAGAPVRAARLRLEPLALGASIATHDSLQEGSSRFYAEITRLRQVLDLTAGERTVLFLLDELLSGTNSHDRRIGAEALVRSLVDRGAIGLFTTHDLALARIAEGLAPRAANVHFQDELRDGRMHFDYVMRPGVVERSNALALMRAVGLDV